MTRCVAFIAATSLAATFSASAQEAATSQLTPTIGSQLQNTIIEPTTGTVTQLGLSESATALIIGTTGILIAVGIDTLGDDDDGDGNGTTGSPSTN